MDEWVGKQILEQLVLKILSFTKSTTFFTVGFLEAFYIQL